MKAHILLHVSFEGAGSILSWLERREAGISTTRLYLDEKLPDLQSTDLLIVMGGPMSVNDETACPWLADEKQLIREAVAKGVSVLGICLGAQLIASALGSPVYAGSRKEIGWFPVRAVCSDSPVFRFPDECLVFQWHGETFDLPPGAVRLATGAVCENQAFQLGKNVIGLQFHLESTPESVISMLENCANELVADDYVQPAAEIVSAAPGQFLAINALMDDLLEYLAANSCS